MKLYVPNNINIDNVLCVYIESDDSIIISENGGTYYRLSYNNLISDYITTPLYYENFDVVCHDVELTHDYFYRKDISDIMIVFFILSLVCFLFPYKIFSRAFGRWLKI